MGIFIEVAQDPAKHRVFELGSLYQPETVGHSYASFPSVTSTFPGTLQPQLDKVRVELQVEIEARKRLEGEVTSLAQKFSSFREQCQHDQEQYMQKQALITRIQNERDTLEGWRP